MGIISQYPRQLLITNANIQFLPYLSEVGVAFSHHTARVCYDTLDPMLRQLEMGLLHLSQQHLFQGFVLDANELFLALACHCLHTTALRRSLLFLYLYSLCALNGNILLVVRGEKGSHR